MNDKRNRKPNNIRSQRKLASLIIKHFYNFAFFEKHLVNVVM